MDHTGGSTGLFPPSPAAFELSERADLDPLLLEPYVTGPATPRRRQRDGNAPSSFFRRPWQDALGDIRRVGWAPAGLWLLFFCWFASLLTTLILVSVSRSGYYSDSGSACLPDGSFSIFRSYDPWDIYGFFQITIGFGELTFTQAKVIDVIWDVVSCDSNWAEAERFSAVGYKCLSSGLSSTETC